MLDSAIWMRGRFSPRRFPGSLLACLVAGCSADPVGVTRESVLHGDSTPVTSARTAVMASQTGEPARMADSLVESIGINTHINFANYAAVWDAFVRSRILELGVRHVRDLGEGSVNAGTLARALDLYTTAGIRFGNVCKHQSTDFTDASHCISQLNARRQGFGGSTAWLDFVGGENEMDLGGVGGDPQYVQHWTQWQTALYNVYQADSVWDAFPVLMSSISRPAKEKALGNNSGILDIGDMHSYPDGMMPSVVGDAWIPAARTVVGPNKPIWATETGYHNSLNWTGGQRPTSERASGKYVGRLWFEYFNRGVDRTYLYEMWDEGTTDKREHHFGLLRNDGSPKPQFIVTKNIITLLNDPGPAFAPGTLDYTLSGTLSTTHKTLLQKRDGRFYLVLWQEVSVWNRTKKQDLTNTDDSITLALGTAATSIQVYRPGQGTSPVQTGSGTIITLDVPDEVVLVEVSP